MTGLFFILIEYYFTILGYVKYWKGYENEDFGNRCENMLICLVTSFDFTFKETGALGAYLSLEDEADIGRPNLGMPVDIGKWFFDNFFNIVLV